MRRVMLAGALALAAVCSVPEEAAACDPPPGTSCSRKVWLSLQVEKTGVLADGEICLEIGVLAFVCWDLPAPPCPRPSAMRIKLQLKDGQNPVGDLVTVDLPTPTIAGLQTAVDRVEYKVDGAAIPGGAPFCGIMCGTLEVDWIGGPAGKNGQLTASRQVEVCLGQPSKFDKTVPRLAMCCLSKDGLLYQVATRGDQCNSYYLICNNDPCESVTLDLESLGEQVAILPDGFDVSNQQNAQATYDAGVTAVSNPNPGTDTFAAALRLSSDPEALLSEELFDPGSVDPVRLERTGITIQPLDCIIVCIAQRSFGMCRTGSCVQRGVKVRGQFEGGDLAIACAQSAFAVVDEAPRKFPLCRFTCRIKAHPEMDTQWDPGVFMQGQITQQPIPHATVFPSGNLPPDSGLVGTQITGVNGPAVDPTSGDRFPAEAFDEIAFDGTRLPDTIVTRLGSFAATPQSPVQSSSFVDIQIVELSLISAQPIIVPAIHSVDPVFDLQVTLTVDAATNEISGNGMLTSIIGPFQPVTFPPTPLNQLIQNPPPGLVVVPETCFELVKVQDVGDKFIYPSTGFQSLLVGKKDRDDWLHCNTQVIDGRTRQPTGWAATATGAAATVTQAAGNAAEQVPIELVALSLKSVEPPLTLVPGADVNWVNITCPPDGLNQACKLIVVRYVKKPGKPKVRKTFAKQKDFKNVEAGTTVMSEFVICNRSKKGPFSFEISHLAFGNGFALEDVGLVGRHTLGPKQKLSVPISYSPVADPGRNKGKDKWVVEFLRCDRPDTKPLKIKLVGKWVVTNP